MASALALGVYNALIAGLVAGTITTGAHVQTFLGTASNLAGFTELCAGDRSRFRALAEQLPLQDSLLALRASVKYPVAARVWTERPEWGAALAADATAIGSILDRPPVLARLVRTNGHTLAPVAFSSSLATALAASQVRRGNWERAVGLAGSKVSTKAYTGSSTWTAPGQVVAMRVFLVGGGSAGQDGGGSGGVGGGGGQVLLSTLSTPFPSATSVVVGQGGIGSLASGGSTSFGAYATATGGSGQTGATGGTPSGAWADILTDQLNFTIPQLMTFPDVLLNGGSGGSNQTAGGGGGGGGGAGGGNGATGLGGNAGLGGAGRGVNAAVSATGAGGGGNAGSNTGVSGAQGGGALSGLSPGGGNITLGYGGGGGGGGSLSQGGGGGFPGGGGGGGGNSGTRGNGGNGFAAVMCVVA